MKISDYLSREEISYFTRKSDARGLLELAYAWGLTFLVFFVMATWTNPLTLVLGFLMLGGRQLHLAVIMHDCGHNLLFKTPSWNRLFGNRLAANMVFADMPSYARGHLQHHKLAGTDQDPDLPNYQNYPVKKQSFKRKVIRDLTGQTGWKLLKFVLKSAAHIFSGDKAKRDYAKPFVQELMAQVALAVVLGVLFAPWAYLLWLGSFLTIYMLIARIRQLAEHACMPDLFDLDPRMNTRTTIVPWWEKILFAPGNVNYHLEHHMMASVPCYRLPELHRTMKEKGAYDDTRIYHGYGEVMADMIKA